jgi:hypothetical protein
MTSISRFNFVSKWKNPVLLMLCGIFLGLGWTINILFVTFTLVVIPFLFIVRPKIKHLLWIIAGFLFIIFLEFLIVKIECGSWFARISCILKTEEDVESNIASDYLPRALFKIWNINPLRGEGHFGIIWYLFVVATILALLLKEKLPLALALGCWLWIAYLQWGVQSFDGSPIAKYIRYISMIVPVQCLVFGAILGRLLKFSKKLNPVIILLFTLLCAHLIWIGTKAVDTVKIRTEDFKKITRYLLNLELTSDDIIYTDTLTANFIRLYSEESLNVEKVTFQEPKLEQPGKGILVVDGSWYAVMIPGYRNSMPDWSLSPPAHWPLLHTVRGRKIEQYKDFDPKIYRILPQN